MDTALEVPVAREHRGCDEPALGHGPRAGELDRYALGQTAQPRAWNRRRIAGRVTSALLDPAGDRALVRSDAGASASTPGARIEIRRQDVAKHVAEGLADARSASP